MPKVASTLHSNLMRFGLSEHDAEDVVQEVFARALAYRAGFATARDFTRWATIVARNLGYDRLRELGRVEGGELPDQSLPDAAEEAERAADAEALVRAYESLSESDRRVLYQAADGVRPTSDPERERFRVWLSRARSRLRGRLHGWAVALPARFRLAELENLTACFGSALLTFGLGVVVATSRPHVADPSHARAESVLPAMAPASPPTLVPSHPVAAEPVIRPPLGRHTPEGGAGPERTESTRVTHERVEVAPPGGKQVVAVDVHESDTEDPPPLVCLWNTPILGSSCVDK